MGVASPSLPTTGQRRRGNRALAKAGDLASQLCSRAGQLETSDRNVTGRLAGAMHDFGQVAPGAAGHGGSGVRLVDFAQDGGPQPNASPHLPTTEENEKRGCSLVSLRAQRSAGWRESQKAELERFPA